MQTLHPWVPSGDQTSAGQVPGLEAKLSSVWRRKFYLHSLSGTWNVPVAGTGECEKEMSLTHGVLWGYYIN